ncbi:unnamed protein product [Arctia plantaginis]|uniref:FATC domain-containing protein n=1 Tax=Arctia plantaginis TaxID=874455 RepID=A0A8S0YM58_ARCPL|nr:unnamed protein product [Arctia plantaginis]
MQPVEAVHTTYLGQRELLRGELKSLPGIFRLACEHVIRTMRRGRETLLTLLEAFVYDPLVEWGGGGTGGGKRRRTQRDVKAALAMLAVRAHELKHQLGEVTDQFLAVLPEIKQCTNEWLKENEELKSVETRLKDCHQQMAMIKEIEAYGPNLNTHPLYAISQKYTSYKQAKNAVEDSMKALVKILKDFDTQIENFANTTEAINGPQLVAWVQEFSGSNEEEEQPIFEHIKEFLTNAGQSSMISQCEQAETELYQSMKQTHHVVRACLELLSQYVAVSQYYPQSHTEYHRIVMFRKFLAAALESKSPDVCREVINQVTTLVNSENNKNDTSQQIISYNYRLQSMNTEANTNLTKAIERLQLEGGPDALALAQEAYREAKTNISNWVRTEEGSGAALEGAVIGMLCNLNRRYLMLENGAQSAGDCLVDLTSREGEWFLDDMSALSMQAVELLSLLPLQSASAEDAAMPVAVECVRNANLLLADLVQLNFNFSTIILPEAVKKLHSEDPSVLLMINELNAVIINSPVPLNELLTQLELHLRYLVMDMESPASSAPLIAAEVRTRYEALLSTSPSDAEGQSAGRMLLMGFNGLFAAVELRAKELADHLAIPIPPAWRKIDHISESMHMSAALQSPILRSVLEDIFLIRRVQTIAEVFAMCAQMACSFKGTGPVTLYDDAALCKPVRRFTAEYVSRCVLGVHSKALASVLCLLLRRARLDLHAEVEQKEIGASWSVPLETLCEKARRRGVAGGVAERGAALARSVQSARARVQRAARAHSDHARRAAHAHRARLTHAAHTHLHAEVLGGNQETSAQLARRSRELTSCVEKLSAATTKAQTLINSAHQRVKWGAGANPALGGVCVALERAGGGASARAARLSAAGAALASHARAAAALRLHKHQHKHHHALLTHLHHWEKACTLAQKYSLKVSPIEESLMEMLHPEGNIDTQWVENVSMLLREMISSLSAEALRLGARVRGAGEAVRGAAARLAPPDLARAGLLLDVRAPLHTLQAEGTNPASEWLSSESGVSELIKACVHVRADEPGVAAARRAATALADQLAHHHDHLLQLHSNWTNEVNGRRLTRQGAITGGPRASANIRHGGERNAVGAGVWKRVRLKLEGRDETATPTALKRHPPHDQVEYIISEARMPEKLCLMYEGWMAWV